MNTVQRIGALIGLVCLVAGLIAPLSHIAPTIQLTLGIALFALCFWTFEPVPIQLSSLFLLALYPLTDLLTFEESFAPFAGKTIWLIFTGMAISMALEQTGVGTLLANIMKRVLSRHPAFLIAQLHFIGLATAFIVPSGVVRVLLLFPIGLALCNSLKCTNDPKATTVVLLSLVSSTVFGGFGILTGAVPNMILAGQLHEWGNESIFWSTWFIWMFPLVGIGRSILSAFLIWVFWGRTIAPFRPIPQKETEFTFTTAQKKTLGVLTLGVIGWATDTVHQIPPVYIALAVVLILLIPHWGTLNVKDLKKLDFTFLFYITALFSLGTALSVSGFNDAFINNAVEWAHLSKWDLPQRYFALTLLAVPLDFVMDIAAVAAVVTHPFLQLAAEYELGILPAAMSIGMATTLVFLPYQAAPLMVAYSYRKFALSHLILLQFSLSLLSLIFLYPLNLVYWSWAGFL
jgi:anion transporter